MDRTVIVSTARTPFGKMSGALKDFKSPELGALVIKEALKRAGVAPELVENVLMGIVLQAGVGQIPSRQAAIKAGIPATVPSLTLNKVCASGMRAITLADQLQRVGDGEIFVAGGMESMTNAPYLLKQARSGYRMGNAEVIDGMMFDGLTCAFHNVAMGVHGDTTAKEFGQTREEMDAWAARSHHKVHEAAEAGRLDAEIVAVPVPQRKGDPVMVTRDEGVRPDTSSEALAKLRAAFTKDGVITAGNAPGISDGAAALVLMSERKAHELGLKPLAAIVGHAKVGAEPAYLSTVPGLAIQKALAQANLTVDQMDLFEINEAFAAVTLRSTDILSGGDAGKREAIRERTNVNGGAIALGHPIGASGARIVASLAHELSRRGGRYGVAAICSGAAQGDAIILERL
ncbi:MAG TPA: acetyl-CoA C-acetyltransferase [Pantanalinema sp.]